MTKVFTIDNGNSYPNIALFIDGVLSEIFLKNAFLECYAQAPENSAAIMANVGQPNELSAFFGTGLIHLAPYRSSSSFLDMPVNYSLTLGEDRLALAYHVYKTMPMELPALIIDSGTFTTVDLVTEQGFVGGYIFPGVRRFFEIYGHSARLPDLSTADFSLTAQAELPHTTPEAILQAGTIYWNGVFKEIATGWGTNLQTVVLTGGDASKLKPLLANIFKSKVMLVDAHLMHLSLYSVYQNIKELRKGA